jgi:hypothetical protein
LTAPRRANSTPKVSSMAVASTIAAFPAGIGPDMDARVASEGQPRQRHDSPHSRDREPPVDPVGRSVFQAASGGPCTELRRSRFVSTPLWWGFATAIAIAGCGATNTTTATTATTAGTTSQAIAPVSLEALTTAWESDGPLRNEYPSLRLDSDPLISRTRDILERLTTAIQLSEKRRSAHAGSPKASGFSWTPSAGPS